MHRRKLPPQGHRPRIERSERGVVSRVLATYITSSIDTPRRIEVVRRVWREGITRDGRIARPRVVDRPDAIHLQAIALGAEHERTTFNIVERVGDEPIAFAMHRDRAIEIEVTRQPNGQASERLRRPHGHAKRHHVGALTADNPIERPARRHSDERLARIAQRNLRRRARRWSTSASTWRRWRSIRAALAGEERRKSEGGHKKGEAKVLEKRMHAAKVAGARVRIHLAVRCC